MYNRFLKESIDTMWDNLFASLSPYAELDVDNLFFEGSIEDNCSRFHWQEFKGGTDSLSS
jgi:hypothetical protein